MQSMSGVKGAAGRYPLPPPAVRIRKRTTGGNTRAPYPATWKERPEIPSPFRVWSGLDILSQRFIRGSWQRNGIVVGDGKERRQADAHRPDPPHQFYICRKCS